MFETGMAPRSPTQVSYTMDQGRALERMIWEDNNLICQKCC